MAACPLPESSPSRPSRAALWLQLATTALVAAAVAIFVAGFLTPVPEAPYVLFASGGFLLTALAGGAPMSRYGLFVLLGLIGCAAGDVLGPRDFLTGAAAFLAGHLMYIAAFISRGIKPRPLLCALPPLALSTTAILLWIVPRVPPADRPLIFGYIAVITLMVILAAGASSGPSGRLALVAAVIFYISDIFVARWKYAGGYAANALYCYPLYYTACLLFAWSASRRWQTDPRK